MESSENPSLARGLSVKFNSADLSRGLISYFCDQPFFSTCSVPGEKRPRARDRDERNFPFLDSDSYRGTDTEKNGRIVNN